MLSFYLSLIEDQHKDKFEEVYYEYKYLMLNIAYDILDDRFEAEDAVHNAFLILLKHIDKIDNVKSNKTKGFLVIIVENIAKNMYNKRKRNRFLPFKSKTSTHKSLHETVESSMEVERIVSIIRSLPENYRHILILKYINELTNKEIASILNITNSNVRKRLERARKALKELLKENGINEEL